MSEKFKFPSEIVELPSKGLLYPKDNPLSSGQVEIKYMTAKEEDILTNVNFLQNGTVIDKLLQSVILSDIDYDSLLVGDKNAILVATRILGYGSEYEITYNGKPYKVDLSKVENKPINEEKFKEKGNHFEFELPFSKVKITFKLLTVGDEKEIEKEVKGLKKINKEYNNDFLTRLNYMITSIDGDTSAQTIRNFTENYFLARDSRAFRIFLNIIQPDVNLKFYPEDGPEGGVDIPIGIDFLWPDAGI